jgi:hypothetical protein
VSRPHVNNNKKLNKFMLFGALKRKILPVCAAGAMVHYRSKRSTVGKVRFKLLDQVRHKNTQHHQPLELNARVVWIMLSLSGLIQLHEKSSNKKF